MAHVGLFVDIDHMVQRGELRPIARRVPYSTDADVMAADALVAEYRRAHRSEYRGIGVDVQIVQAADEPPGR